MNSLSRLLELLPEAVLAEDKNRLIAEAPYVVLITGCDAQKPIMEDFVFGGKVEWCKHRTDAIKDTREVPVAGLFKNKYGDVKNFKLAFFANKVDPEADPNSLLFAARLVVRGYQNFEENPVKLITLRNQITYNSLTEHLVYMSSKPL